VGETRRDRSADRKKLVGWGAEPGADRKRAAQEGPGRGWAEPGEPQPCLSEEEEDPSQRRYLGSGLIQGPDKGHNLGMALSQL
jgi:hypothetical protein